MEASERAGPGTGKGAGEVSDMAVVAIRDIGKRWRVKIDRL
jgi:hypothetical protein